MIRSMTGFCSLRETVEETQLTLDIKTLNNKSFDLNLNAPRVLSMLEIRIRDYVKERIPRGRIEIGIRGSRLFIAEKSILANIETAKQYHEAARSIAEAIGVRYEPNAESFLTVNGVLETEETAYSLDDSWEIIRGFIDKALQEVVQMKIHEGAALETELNQLLNQIEALRVEIAELRPLVLNEFRQKMIDRIAEWEQKVDLDENRMIQEIAILGDRSDIQEELVRLQGHIRQFRDAMNENNGSGKYLPVGRRLDFLCQEMFREINTTGSKCAHLEISKRVIQLKTIADQLREQVQNVE